MSPYDNDPIDDQFDPLDKLLNQWQAPDPPTQLDAAVVRGYRRQIAPRGLRWWLHGSLKVPVPIAFACLTTACLLFAFLVFYRRTKPMLAQPKIVVETRTVEVPVIQDRVRIVYRDRSPHTVETPTRSAPATTADQSVRQDHGFQFVTSLTPRIVRRDHVDQN